MAPIPIGLRAAHDARFPRRGGSSSSPSSDVNHKRRGLAHRAVRTRRDCRQIVRANVVGNFRFRDSTGRGMRGFRLHPRRRRRHARRRAAAAFSRSDGGRHTALARAKADGAIAGYGPGVNEPSGGAVPYFNCAPAAPNFVARVAAIEAVCTAHRVPLKAAALQFLLAHPAVTCVVAGVRSAVEIEDNATMMSRPIPPAFWRDLRAGGLLPADAPVPAAI